MPRTPRQKFADALATGEMIQAPGCYDGLTAKLIERAGFQACYMTGAGTASGFGLPDYGLVTATEMVSNAARIAAAVDIPVIADADTGFGNELNVTRAIREYERAGVAAIHMEDQGFPKKCGHLDDKVIIPLEEYLAKIRAAVAARQDPDFKVIARTDSNAGMGFEEAVRRCNAALDAGADIAFLEAPKTDEEFAAVTQRVNGPCLFNLVLRGKTPPVTVDGLKAAGFALTIMPDLIWREMVMRAEEVLSDLKSGTLPSQTEGLKVSELFERVGSKDWDDLRDAFTLPAQAAE
ncbi:MAG: isocitrate lyase/PEP mutase family protein [Pseudomonadota bacterium]